MPFAYYGAKHGLARRYPPPAHRTVVEPFAGSAGYAVHHAAKLERVLLYDIDPAVVALWHELQTMTPADVDRIGAQVERGKRFTHPLLAGMAGGSQMAAVLAGKSRMVTPRMVNDWPRVRRRILTALPHFGRWEIRLGTYADAPDIDATWFVDPPYQPLLTYTSTSRSGAADGYRYGAVDYAELGAWCRTRRGLVIVCEQSPAAWLPFAPLARQKNGVADGAVRTEVVWRNDAEQTALFDLGATA